MPSAAINKVSKVTPAHEAFKKLREGRSTPRMPVMFVGHGNPMNAIADNKFSREWKKMVKELVKPNAIVCISAHWLAKGSYVTAMPRPRIIYDFYGFPDELYKVKYDACGDPALANDMCKIVKGIKLDHEWGLDHGAWSVLKRMFPEADVPVIQLSVDYSRSPAQEY